MYQEEISVLLDALDDYAVEHAGEQNADTARELIAKAETLRELPEDQLALMVKAAQALAA